MRCLSILILCYIMGTAAQQHSQSNGLTSQVEAKIPKPLPAYDVVVINPTKGLPTSGGYGDDIDGFSLRGLPLKALITEAYNLRDDEVSGGPGWVSTMPFDIEAKLDPENVVALQKFPIEQQKLQRRLMLQSLLVNRFRLQVHRVEMLQTSYDLVLAKNGPKMKEDNTPTDLAGHKWQEGIIPTTDWSYADGRISGHAEPMLILAHQLSNATGSVVADKTGLTGRYDVLLQWDPSDSPTQESTEPSLFPAIEQQLGLKLKPTKTEAQKLIIDHIEKPTSN